MILDREAPELVADVLALLDSPVIPDEAALLIETWHRNNDYRFLIATEQDDGYQVAFMDDATDLQIAMLETLAGSDMSCWQICAEPAMRQTLTALLLQCGDPVGGVQ